jgi:hypothetical protein
MPPKQTPLFDGNNLLPISNKTNFLIQYDSITFLSFIFRSFPAEILDLLLNDPNPNGGFTHGEKHPERLTRRLGSNEPFFCTVFFNYCKGKTRKITKMGRQ